MTPEEITTLFASAAASFPAIVGQPTDDDLTAMHEVLHPLLLDIPYDRGTGPGELNHNLIGLIEPTATYSALWGEAFPIPAQPPTYPDIPDNATAVVRAREEANDVILVKDFAEYEAAKWAFAKFIRDAVNELWYTNIMAAKLMAHLDANCRGLHPSELVSLPT